MKTGAGIINCWKCGKPMLVAWAGRHYDKDCIWCGTKNRIRRSKLSDFRYMPAYDEEEQAPTPGDGELRPENDGTP